MGTRRASNDQPRRRLGIERPDRALDVRAMAACGSRAAAPRRLRHRAPARRSARTTRRSAGSISPPGSCAPSDRCRNSRTGRFPSPARASRSAPPRRRPCGSTPHRRAARSRPQRSGARSARSGSPRPRRRPAGRKILPTLPPNRNGSRAPSPASNASRTAIGSQIGATAAPCTPRAIRRCRKVVLSEGAPPPALSVVSAITIGPPGCGQRRVDRAVDVDGSAARPARATRSARGRSASASLSPCGLASSVMTRMRAPHSGTSP